LIRIDLLQAGHCVDINFITEIVPFLHSVLEKRLGFSPIGYLKTSEIGCPGF